MEKVTVVQGKTQVVIDRSCLPAYLNEITASPLPVTVTIAAPSMRSLGSSRLSTILSRSEICDPAEVLLFFLI